VAAGGKCITLTSDATITEAVELLSSNNILAAPVINLEPGSARKYLCVRMCVCARVSVCVLVCVSVCVSVC
jgi:hypothetical protein